VLREASRSIGGPLGVGAIVAAVAAIVMFTGAAAWNDMIGWRSIVSLANVGTQSGSPPAAASAPVSRDAALPLPRRGETALLRARGLVAGGHLRDALSALDAVRPTDPQRPDADRLRADIQRQLLALTPLPSADREKGERRNR
jgi:hypothetical protein